jgi:hypothetical protein
MVQIFIWPFYSFWPRRGKVTSKMKSVINVLLVGIAIVTMLSVTAVVSAQKDAQEATETAKATSDYVLPYPGILPGHPLYPIKMARDQFLGWLITDPLKKAEYNLLMADKRLNSGYYLIQYGKQKDGIVTISKGEKYFGMALEWTKTAKSKGKDINPFKDTMIRSSLKHEEILTSLIEKGPMDIRAEANQVFKMVQDFQLQVKAL